MQVIDLYSTHAAEIASLQVEKVKDSENLKSVMYCTYGLPTTYLNLTKSDIPCFAKRA